MVVGQFFKIYFVGVLQVIGHSLKIVFHLFNSSFVFSTVYQFPFCLREEPFPENSFVFETCVFIELIKKPEQGFVCFLNNLFGLCNAGRVVAVNGGFFPKIFCFALIGKQQVQGDIAAYRISI